MRKGKMVAQGSHASCSFMSFKLQGGQKLTKEEEAWLNGSFAKICVRVDSEEELLAIYQQAKDAMLTVHLITDSGKTEFNGVPTKTCLAIGPHVAGKIDKITGHLKLL
jgi:PTH2 family peptidyl-tRNA hydrolase